MGGGIGNLAKSFGNKSATDPSQAWADLSGGEKGARITSGALQGLSNGLQNRQAQSAQMRQPGAAAPIQVQPNPVLQNQFDPNYLMNRQQQPMGPRNAMPFGQAFYGR